MAKYAGLGLPLRYEDDYDDKNMGLWNPPGLDDMKAAEFNWQRFLKDPPQPSDDRYESTMEWK